MNRAFLVIAIPALAVALFWITFGWGWRVSLPLGIAIIILASVGFLVWRRRRNAAPNR